MDVDEAVGLPIWKGLEQRVVKHSEHCRSCADSNTKNRNAEKRQRKVFSDLAEAVPEIKGQVSGGSVHGCGSIAFALDNFHHTRANRKRGREGERECLVGNLRDLFPGWPSLALYGWQAPAMRRIRYRSRRRSRPTRRHLRPRRRRTNPVKIQPTRIPRRRMRPINRSGTRCVRKTTSKLASITCTRAITMPRLTAFRTPLTPNRDTRFPSGISAKRRRKRD